MIAVGCITIMIVSVGACGSTNTGTSTTISVTEVTDKAVTSTEAITTEENSITEITDYTDSIPIILGETVSSKEITVEGSKTTIIAGGKTVT